MKPILPVLAAFAFVGATIPAAASPLHLSLPSPARHHHHHHGRERDGAEPSPPLKVTPPAPQGW